MTDRVLYLTVVLTDQMRTDDAQELADSIARMRGIAKVDLGPACDNFELHHARMTLGNELIALGVDWVRGKK